MEQCWSVVHPTPGAVENAVENWVQSGKAGGHHNLFSGSSAQRSRGQRVKEGVIENEAVRGVRVCDGPIWALSCSARGSIAAGCCDAVVRVRRLSLLIEQFEVLNSNEIETSSEKSNDLELRGHGGAILDVAWAPEEESGDSISMKEEVLVSVSEDKTARLWQVLTTSASCLMVCSHGAPVVSCAFLDVDSFVTGGLDRTVRIWHAPSGRATAWAHCNDVITSVAATKARVQGPKNKDGRRVAVGLRGGQIFTYTSKAHNDLLFDEMVLTTMRAGAFLEAERCGATGMDEGTKPNGDDLIDSSTSASVHDTSLAVGTSAPPSTMTALPAKKKTSKSKFQIGLPKSIKFKQRLFGSGNKANRASPVANTEEALLDAERYSDDFDTPPAPPSADNEADSAPYGPPAASVEYVERRVTQLSWYAVPIDPDQPTKDLHERIRLLAASNGDSVLKVLPGARPDKPPKLRLDGGARIVLGCGARPSASGNVAVGGSEDGTLFFWKLTEPDVTLSGISSGASQGESAVPTSKSPVPPAPLISASAHLELDPPNSRVKAVTAALFAPAQAARSALLDSTRLALDLSANHTADNDTVRATADNTSKLSQCDWSSALALAADYSGRLLVVAYESSLRPVLLDAVRLNREAALNSPPPPGHAALSPRHLPAKTEEEQRPIQQPADSPSVSIDNEEVFVDAQEPPSSVDDDKVSSEEDVSPQLVDNAVIQADKEEPILEREADDTTGIEEITAVEAEQSPKAEDATETVVATSTTEEPSAGVKDTTGEQVTAIETNPGPKPDELAEMKEVVADDDAPSLEETDRAAGSGEDAAAEGTLSPKNDEVTGLAEEPRPVLTDDDDDAPSLEETDRAAGSGEAAAAEGTLSPEGDEVTGAAEEPRPNITGTTENELITDIDDASILDAELAGSEDTMAVDLDEIDPTTESKSALVQNSALNNKDNGLPQSTIAPAIHVDAADRISATSVRSESLLVAEDSQPLQESNAVPVFDKVQDLNEDSVVTCDDSFSDDDALYQDARDNHESAFVSAGVEASNFDESGHDVHSEHGSEHLVAENRDE